MSTVPPIGAVRTAAQEEERRKKRMVVDPATGQEREERYRGEPGDIKTRELAGKAWGGVKKAAGAAGEFLTAPRGEGMMGPYPPRTEGPATTGQAKKAEGEATQAAAHQVARQRAPEGQPDVRAPAESTNSGAAGPRGTLAEGTPTDPETGEVDPTQFGRYGSVFVHRGKGPDPATQPGGFAHAGASEDERIAALPERGTTEYGPERRTATGVPLGGHEWTRRTPGRQEATYDQARYQQQVRGRQAGEEAGIQELGAREAAALAGISRSQELEEDPFAPEKAQVATAVGEQVAKARPEREAMELAMGLADQLQARMAEIRSDASLDDATREQMIQEAKDLFWSYLAGIRPRARKPREEFPILPPETEET